MYLFLILFLLINPLKEVSMKRIKLVEVHRSSSRGRALTAVRLSGTAATRRHLPVSWFLWVFLFYAPQKTVCSGLLNLLSSWQSRDYGEKEEKANEALVLVSFSITRCFWVSASRHFYYLWTTYVYLLAWTLISEYTAASRHVTGHSAACLY